MTDNDNIINFTSVKGGNTANVVSASGDSLAQTIISDLESAGLIAPIEYDETEGEHLSLVNAGELPLGPLNETERRLCYAYLCIDEELETFIRDKNVQVSQSLTEALRDRSLTYEDAINSVVTKQSFTQEEQQVIMRLSHSARLLKDIWGYQVKRRFNSWGRVGARKHWLAVSVPLLG